MSHLWTSCILLCALLQTIGLSAYERPAKKAPLPLSHDRLKRKSHDPHTPEQIHLALAGSGAVAVSWVTYPQEDENLTAATSLTNLAKKAGCSHLAGYPLLSTVQWGREPANYEQESTGNFTCYSSEEYESGALHTVVVGTEGPLDANATYFYRCGDPRLGWSEELTFRTPPVVGPDSIPYKLGLIGDLGQTADSAETLDHLDAQDVVSVLDVGDLSYADSYQPRWDSYGRLLEYHTSRVPWMHIEGNHEEEVINGQQGFLAYKTRFYFPAQESQSHSPFYYSYETGPIHVIMLGCYVEYSRHSEQAQWLQRDLAAVDRARTPWLLVGMHAPWYNSNTAHQAEVDDMREALEPFLYEHGVDAVFAGHVHAYERSQMGVYKWKQDPCGPIYIVIGDGGNREGLAPDYLPKPSWSGVREASFGMGTFTVMNRTHALWRWHRNQDKASQVADEFWLQRSPKCSTSVAEGSPLPQVRISRM